MSAHSARNNPDSSTRSRSSVDPRDSLDPRRGVDPRARRSAGLRIQNADLIDAAFLAALTVLALIGFRTTYSGTGYLVTGVVALVLGILLAYLVNSLRGPAILTAALLIVVYFLFGGALVLRSEALGQVLPTGSVLSDLTSLLIHGWKQMLTTLPPVASDGPLLVIPYILGLVSGALGFTGARRLRSAGLPVLVPVAVLAAVILLGTAQPAARLLQGVVFGCIALCWAFVRGRRNGAPIRNASGRSMRLVIGAVVLVVTGVGAAFLGPHMPGTGQNRVVLRTYVTPPFDIGAYPSPLVGFRKYTKDANLLYDQTLFTVSGLPNGDQIRIATLDDYNGSVWGATNGTVPTGPDQPLDSFQRVGTQIRTDATGKKATLKVHIAAAYSASRDADAWLPTAGTLESVAFTGANAGGHQEDFRYNLATGSGIVADRLQTGDSYTLHTVISTPGLPAGAQPFGAPTLDPGQDAFVSTRADQWSAKIPSVIGQVNAVARYMRQNGAYSDGGPGEAQYLPGHSVYRLSTFLNAPQLVGDDEQYSAAFALMCNYLGLPARVVLGATPEADGTVKGEDVHAAVEVHISSGGPAGTWALIPRTQFMPDQSKKPDKQPPLTQQDANAAVVPPPNPVRPPSTLDQPDQPDRNTTHLGKSQKPGGSHGLPGWLITIAKYVGIPLLAVLFVCGLIIGGKAWRRRRRRSRGSTTDRFATGWRELLDHALDLGAAVPAGRTRQEQATALAAQPIAYPAVPMASAADAGVFGPYVPHAAAATEFWSRVDAVRKAMSGGAGRWRRIRAAVSLRSFLRRASVARAR